MMKLWLLQASYEIVVIRAESEAAARQLKYNQTPNLTNWVGYLDPNQSTCEEIKVEGDPGVIAEHSG